MSWLVIVAVMGTEAHADISHVLVEGEHMADSFFGYNLINGIFVEGWMEWMGRLPHHSLAPSE
jgi:hypothetical protein